MSSGDAEVRGIVESGVARVRIGWGSAGLTAALMLAATAAHAQSAVGDGLEALPAGYLVPIATPFARGVSVAGTVGYGYTEGVLDGTDSHHRVSGVFSAAARPFSWLALGLRFDGRYDASTGAQGNHDGWIADPRLFARAAGRLLGWLGLGLQASLWLPSATFGSFDGNAASAEFQGLASYAPEHGRFTLGVEGGYRIDHSARSVPSPAALSPAQRLGLDLSAFDAVIVGAVGVVRLAPIEAFAEWRWDVLVGSNAPTALLSPMHVRIGGRVQPLEGRNLFLGVTLDATLSQRPVPGAPETLIAVDPLVSAFLTLDVRLPFGRATPPVPVVEPIAPTAPSSSPPPPASSSPPPRPITGALAGRVADPAGAPVAGASVHAVAGERTFDTTTDTDGRYHIDDVPIGAVEITVHAEGREDVHLTSDVRAGPVHEESVSMSVALPRGQIRGQVHGFGGEVVRVTVRIPELGLEEQANAEGRFTVDVAPGRYTLHVSAAGYEEQTRPVRVELNGVTVLNVDLRRRR